MKTLILATTLFTATIAAHARGYHSYSGSHGYGYRSPRISFYWGGGYPLYSPWYSSHSYPSYDYGYDYYSYSRPNYTVNGTLTGALIGGLIGNSVRHQGWEGAGVGAAAGLVLGSLAEHNARAYERSYYTTPTVQQQSYIPAAPTIKNAPTIPDAPRVPSATTYRPTSAMSSANSLFGR